MINPTVAKYIAIYFFEKKKWKITAKQMAIQVQHAKNLLKVGFTEEEIMKGIDYFTSVCPPSGGMYSLGYLNNTLNTLLERLNQPSKQFNTIEIEDGEICKGESTNNNRRKFDHQSRIGTQYNFDLFKESREDN